MYRKNARFSNHLQCSNFQIHFWCFILILNYNFCPVYEKFHLFSVYIYVIVSKEMRRGINYISERIFFLNKYFAIFLNFCLVGIFFCVYNTCFYMKPKWLQFFLQLQTESYLSNHRSLRCETNILLLLQCLAPHKIQQRHVFCHLIIYNQKIIYFPRKISEKIVFFSDVSKKNIYFIYHILI